MITDNVLGPLDQTVTVHIWREKYRHGSEATPSDTFVRVVGGVYAKDDAAQGAKALAALEARDWVPGGRIFAGAGTTKRVTWINCFVSPTIQDSMDSEPGLPGVGIMPALNVAAFTQQQGGGIGMDFGTLRPDGAVVGRTGSISSGVIPFMAMWDGMCVTIRSSGSRRGAMMGVLPVWHPDVLAFISAKTRKDFLKNFNVSVTITDDFMAALEVGADWDLGFHVPRADGEHVAVGEKDGRPWYVYRRLPAAELFDLITRTTYDYAEPGVIFIDRVNRLNNLNYCETIAATNPCGEQPLPPNGDCDLGHVNLANMVLNPFTPAAAVDWDRLRSAVQVGVRFLDNVLDTSPFPTPEQRAEALAKRRIGLGYTGLGNLLQQMRVRYGRTAAALVEEIGKAIAIEAYRTSVALARERGTFPAYDTEAFARAPFLTKLPADLVADIRTHGIRNGVLLTLAPTGTTSIFYGNVSSGVEPTFSWHYDRAVVIEQTATDQTLERFEVQDYGWYLYSRMPGFDHAAALPDYMVTALELSVDDHIAVAAAAQAWVDAAISKTINCPADMPYEAFREVYLTAYRAGMKGCTTYRPSGIRGSVLSVKSDTTEAEPVVAQSSVSTSDVLTRPQVLSGKTVKIKWPIDGENYYLTINDYVHSDGRRVPFEIFISTSSVENFETMAALTRTLSAACRRGDATFLFEELERVHSPKGGALVRLDHETKGSYAPSLIALIGRILRQHSEPEPALALDATGEQCPSCKRHTAHMLEGCLTCYQCGYSKCG
ncbi:adenosylcobalamin-dependent ribonucleoside-diphosphate reductase [Sphingomonas sp. CFBP 13706]|uniref:adenosylcobalamin-dependent ribonucleoside-diphosphate reductase n=1 Tax=Sphingomonas sp. CFBP 13706 TaxID=2775314 RepID=UPI001780ED76|nr:adenosylcobalamin-dependent ribonucleoside-diphosphate reductase [Sphingomonas sp. CFBP 13706]MBD8735356.1 adenosylcobalamin-dependent ribonucleoside-diphosphate reductase [Sphingomonas sp. CFBP 13706]